MTPDNQKLALLTGAAGVLGSETARILAADGYRVILVDIEEKKLAALAQQIGKAGYPLALDVADPQKVAVFGGSFGGLKVLTALTQSPDLFAAGIDINGISDISTMLEEVPVYWRGWPHWYKKYIGDPNDPDQLKEIRERSPLYHADKVKAPVLIIQGSNDVRVIQDQADRVVKALEAAGKDVDYVLLKGAGMRMVLLLMSVS